MNELIPVKQTADEQLVSARDLYDFLMIKKRFSAWWKQYSEMFFDNEDFSYVPKSTQQNQHGGTKEIDDYALKLDVAKHIAMLTRTDKGAEARNYFIQLEKLWNSPEMVTKRALEFQQRKIEKLELENTSMKPKALFADAVATSQSSILIGELAKVLRQNSVEIGQQRLFKWLRGNGYLIKRGAEYNNPTQYSIERGWFEIKKRTGVNPDGSTWASSTTKVTGKGQIYFVNKFLAEKKDIA